MGLDGNSKAGITGTINQKKSETEVPNLTGKVHLLPCCIKYDGPSAVSHYFKPVSKFSFFFPVCPFGLPLFMYCFL